MATLALGTGVGSFQYVDAVGGTLRTLRVHAICPNEGLSDAPIVIAMHGLDRKAADFRDLLVAPALRNQQIVLVPEFDPEQFPGVYAYNFGGVRLAPPDNRVLPRVQWTFSLLDRMFAHVHAGIGSRRKGFGLFGNSAGSQFVLRYLALMEATFVERAVASNSGVYMLPDLARDYPVGMGGLDLDRRHLRRYFERPLDILLGDADIDVAAHDLPRDEVAMAQGAHRLARGQWHFSHCARLADELGTRFEWRLHIVPGAGHVSQQIFDTALDSLK